SQLCGAWPLFVRPARRHPEKAKLGSDRQLVDDVPMLDEEAILHAVDVCGLEGDSLACRCNAEERSGVRSFPADESHDPIAVCHDLMDVRPEIGNALMEAGGECPVGVSPGLHKRIVTAKVGVDVVVDRGEITARIEPPT